MALMIGTSGYVHDDWRGRFYPDALPQEQWLEYYSHHFNSVEVNVTFYRLPASPVFRHWGSRTPRDFQFVLKGSREVTHVNRLQNCHELLAEFFERASELGEKLACILWQLPPKFAHDVELLEDFLEEMERVQIVYGKWRQVFEFQDISWFDEPVYEILKQFNIAVVMADWPYNLQLVDGSWQLGTNKGDSFSTQLRTTNYELPEKVQKSEIIRPKIEVPLTADFLYLRPHGPAAAEPQPYSHEDIQKFADQVKLLKAEHDCYVFFNNDDKAYAIMNATQLNNWLSKNS